jgi:hypothetical protein
VEIGKLSTPIRESRVYGVPTQSRGLALHVLLIEPDYYTQYPPLGLLKISAYHKRRGDTVQYLRGTSRIRQLPDAPDRVYVTSLFTWSWKQVSQAVKMAKLYFPSAEEEGNSLGQ